MTYSPPSRGAEGGLPLPSPLPPRPLTWPRSSVETLKTGPKGFVLPLLSVLLIREGVDSEIALAIPRFRGKFRPNVSFDLRRNNESAYDNN